DLFYSVFTGFPTLHVHIEVDLTGGLAGQIAYNMPHIEPFSRTFDLGVALLGSMPAARLVGKSGKMLIFFSLAYMPAGDGVCHPSNAPLQHRVAGHPHHIIQLPLVG